MAKLRGTAAMDLETRIEVARKGGLKVSQNREHMREIGRRGGVSVSKNRAHMSAIGQKGGKASGLKKPENNFETATDSPLQSQKA